MCPFLMEATEFLCRKSSVSHMNVTACQFLLIRTLKLKQLEMKSTVNVIIHRLFLLSTWIKGFMNISTDVSYCIYCSHVSFLTLN